MPIAISLSPNTATEDVKLAARLLLMPWQWQKGKTIKRVEEKIKSYLGVKEAITFLNGRQCLLAILKSLHLQKGDEVLLQAYTCVVVPNSILAVGLKPVYVDINADTFNIDPRDLEKKITPRSKALLVQHTFGQPAKMAELIKIAKKHHLILIEDAAHSLGAEDQGKKIGSLGKAAFFSFGRDKVISSVFGGVVVTNDQSLAQSLKKLREKAPYPSKFWILQQLLHPLLFHSLIIPFYFCLSFGKILLVILQKTKLLSKAVTCQEKKGQFPDKVFRYPNALAALCLAQLEKLEEINQQRRQMAQFYAKELKGLPIELPKVENDHLFLRYTIKTKKAEKLIDFAKKHKILLGDWYRPVIAPQGVDLKSVFYQTGSCPQAEQAAKDSVNLPTYPRMTLTEAQKVVNLIKKFYGH